MVETWSMSEEMRERIFKREQRRGSRKLKKLKAARRKLSALKPYPRPGYGELKNLSGKTYQVQKNGEWRLVKDFNKDKVTLANPITQRPTFDQTMLTLAKARQL